MAEPKPTFALLDFALATFHTTFIFAVAIFIAFASGALANLLANFNTFIGLALYAVLWLTTWLTTSRARRAMKWNSLAEPLNWVRMVGVSVIAGGANGVLFFFAVLIFGLGFLFFTMLASILSASPPHPDASSILAGTFAFFFSITFSATLGLTLAFIVGGIIGLLYALVDGSLIIGAQYFFRSSETGMEEIVTDEQL